MEEEAAAGLLDDAAALLTEDAGLTDGEAGLADEEAGIADADRGFTEEDDGLADTAAAGLTEDAVGLLEAETVSASAKMRINGLPAALGKYSFYRAISADTLLRTEPTYAESKAAIETGHGAALSFTHVGVRGRVPGVLREWPTSALEGFPSSDYSHRCRCTGQRKSR